MIIVAAWAMTLWWITWTGGLVIGAIFRLSGAWGSVPEGDKADGPGHGLPVCRYIPFSKAIELTPASGGGRPGGRGCG